MPDIQVTIPTSGHDIRLIQIIQYQDGSKRCRIKFEDLTFDLLTSHGEIDGIQQDTPDEPLPNYFNQDQYQGN